MFGCHGPAELPVDGRASDPDRGEPGVKGGRRPDSAGPVRQGKGAPMTSQQVCVKARPHEFREKLPSLHRANSGVSEVAPNDRPAARWQASSGIAVSGTLRSWMLPKAATAGDCNATPASMACSRSVTPARHEPPAGSSPRVRRPHRSDGPARRCPCTCPHSPGRASGPSPHPERPRRRPRPPPS